MHIQVLFFASLREQFGRGVLELELLPATNVASLWRQLSGNNESLPDRVLCAVNQQYVGNDAWLHDGDVVAFFPPVTGG